MPLNLDYYYGNEAEQYSFYRIPKVLFTDRRFRNVSVEAKVLYGLLLDRMSLSAKNGWMDKGGRVYIIFTIADVMETLVCAEQKANKLLNELDTAKGVGLIERKRRGLGKPNVIYVKNFKVKQEIPSENPYTSVPSDPPGGLELPGRSLAMQAGVSSRQELSSGLQDLPWPDAQPGQATSLQEMSRESGKPLPGIFQEPAKSLAPQPVERYRPQGPSKSQIQNCENHKSGNVKITSQDLRKSQTNNTDLNNTEPNETDPSINPLPQGHAGGERQIDGIGRTESFHAYCELIRENISYDILQERYPYDRERLDGFVELMAEICCSSRKTIRINQEEMETEVVKGRFLKLDSSHIQYVMECLDRNTTLVGNIRAYILSALFNAPVTISQYYASLVSHDMANGFGGG